jgi:hypothetical protein
LEMHVGEPVGNGSANILRAFDIAVHHRAEHSPRQVARIVPIHLYRLFLEPSLAGAQRPIDRTTRNVDLLLMEADFLLARRLDDLAPHPYSAMADVPLAYPEFLLCDWDHLLRPVVGRHGSAALVLLGADSPASSDRQEGSSCPRSTLPSRSRIDGA